MIAMQYQNMTQEQIVQYQEETVQPTTEMQAIQQQGMEIVNEFNTIGVTIVTKSGLRLALSGRKF